MKLLSSFVSLAILVGTVVARPPHQDSSAAPTPTPTSAASATLTSSAVPVSGAADAATCSGNLTKFTYFGVNESGAEFGNQNIPGVYQTDYIFPAPSSIDYFVGKGFNFFRVPFLMERLTPPATGITGQFNAAYLALLTETVEYITSKGPHNFMIYNGSTLSSPSDFSTFWVNLANQFKSNDHVIFDLMNEPHDIPAATVKNMMQAAINGIRSTGATQLILVEGTSWTGAWTWTTSGNSAAFATISDPLNNTAIQMHQYLDSDGSGTSATCVSSTIGAERLAAATAWLQQTGLKGFLGEMGAGSNAACISAVSGALCSMQQAGGVWIGFSWWAAGPWWGDYFQSIEPPSGPSVAQILPQALMPFM
ncbi:glycoside hydrolase [Hymenopellis radicata]|nr:glycoside hydrolase [Hymenopellis radicata]